MMFTSEEPTRFGLSCAGSRAMAGALEPDALDAKRDENGTSFLEVGVCLSVLCARAHAAALPAPKQHPRPRKKKI